MTSPHATRRTALAAFAVLAALACIGIPAWQLIGPGPFDWHIRQPAFVQGGLEALVLLGLVAGGCALGRRGALLGLVALPLALYLRRHAVDVPLLLDLLYLEAVIGLGVGVRRVLRLPPPQDGRGYLQAFVLGFLLWSLLAWSLSALGLGSIKALRALTLLLALPAAAARHTPFALYLWRGLRAQAPAARAWSGALAAWIAVLYARSNVVFGYDAQWYGLRGEYVLAPGRSVFEPLGLVSPVHYFPKLYEVFLLPVSALGDSSVIVGMTIGMLVLVLLACHVLAERVAVPPRVRLPVLALIATLPALANSALEPKPDVIALLFVLLAADAALAFARSRAAADAAWLLALGTLACLAKLIAIPYVGALLLASLVAAWHGRATASAPPAARADTRLALAAAGAALGVAAFVTARTWWLAGMPTIGPDPLVRLWHALGLDFAAPVGTLRWTRAQDWADVPQLVLDWLFRPQVLEHVVISWVGNVWLWAAVLALAARPWRRSAATAAHAPLLALLATGALLAVAVRYHARGSDGNYFLAALLPAILLASGAAFTRLATAPRAFALALACVPAFALFQAAYAFASAGWTPGTRTFDGVLNRNWHDTRPLRWKTLEQAGLARIGAYLKAAPGVPRAVGYAAEPASFWLPARFEHLQTVAYSRPEYVDDEARFLQFLRAQRIAYLILPRPDTPQAARVTPAVLAAARQLQADPAVQRVEDRDYVLLDLSALVGATSG
ncbi:MAG: hypothetical protein GXC76_14600 [Rhodanobacteraceae bacterium]|jgi:hypothetical protein|nr:hypothetical protein [Rhodanobacteraceae bacterium]